MSVNEIDPKIIRACAHAAHEANRAYCNAIGDFSQPSIDKAPDWQVQSAIEGVKGVLEKGNGPEQSHEGWLDHKRRDGWVYGEVKDPDKKTHPCMVPYDQLPDAQRTKDHLFVKTVLAVAESLMSPSDFGAVMLRCYARQH